MEAELEEWITELHSRLKKCGLPSTRDVVWDYFHQRMWKEPPPKPQNGMTIFEKRIQIACSDLGVNMNREQIEQTAEALLVVWDKYAYFDPDCLSLLSTLKKQGKILALISNYDHPRHVYKLVRNTGMTDYLSSVIVSGDHGIQKPDPAIYQMALEQTGAEPHETIYIGDSEEDVVGANNAGLISVLIDRNGHGRYYGQRHTISILKDTLKLIHSI